ncbi:cupin domain-containing protein [Streptomyces sp. NRRL B-3648]|uniref:cupin domain-containing protein n=1 Tax=Streptomyces sp. NRRL B-3648 TaxID=1519493 RepID=UPI0006AED666|nr:cupin domain-containing protein [Streptomyces sp. NRRL B-3648]KOV93772.1 cupin [Streptomyces sp. NRRL B-3648]
MSVISPLVAQLGLEPHPEGGWFRRTWQTETQTFADGRRAVRPCATGIYYLLHPGEVSRWHRVRSDEMWLWHRGHTLSLRLGGHGPDPDPDPGPAGTVLLGPGVERGQRPQYLVPAGAWQTAQCQGDEPVLVSCIVAPGFHYDDFEMR